MMYELVEAELDVVAAGAASGGLIAVNVQDVLNHNNVNVQVPVDVHHVAVNVNAAVAVLGGAGAVLGSVV
jgi:hypothetical protein